MGTIGRCLIQPEILLRIYRIIKSNPLKIWGMKELGLNSQSKKSYLMTLVKLNLIEQVPYVYKTGKRLCVRREVMGWRKK
jgi:hypothetical protein